MLGRYELDRVYNTNCVIGMKGIQECSVSLVIGDCPGSCEEVLSQCFRVLKNDGTVSILSQGFMFARTVDLLLSFGFHYCGYLLNRDLPNGPPDYFICGSKAENSNSKLFQSNHFRTSYFHYDAERNWRSFLPLVNMYSSPGSVVLDPYCGTGSVSMAALKTGRRFLAFEVDPMLADVASTRLILHRRF